MIRTRVGRASALAALALFSTAAIGALEAQAGTAATAPEVGQMAPDFPLPERNALVACSRAPVKLSDFRGQTVVVAFFPKARTKG